MRILRVYLYEISVGFLYLYTKIELSLIHI